MKKKFEFSMKKGEATDVMLAAIKELITSPDKYGKRRFVSEIWVIIEEV